MTKLKIQPVMYNSRRLNEVADKIVTVFNPIMNDYQINDRLDSLVLKLILSESVNNDISTELLCGHFLKLLSECGTPILGITSLTMGSWSYGMGSPTYKSAYVSTARSEFGRLDSDIHVERVVIEALHELGHVFGLSHHEGPLPKKTSNGRYCPMDISHSESVLGEEICWAEYISLRDPNLFCENCYQILKSSS